MTTPTSRKTFTTPAPATGGTTLLLIAFIVLKLTHVIDWSWWWVLAPAWIPVALAFLILSIGIPFVGIHEANKRIRAAERQVRR